MLLLDLSGAELWNSLSHDLRSEASLNDFKRKLRHHSFERVQYVLYTASLKSSFST